MLFNNHVFPDLLSPAVVNIDLLHLTKEQEGIFCLGYKVRDNKFLGVQGAQGDLEAEVFQVSNDDTVVAQIRLEDKQPEEKTNTDCLVKEQEKEYQIGWKIKTGNVLIFVIRVNRSPSSAIGFKKPIDMLRFFGWLASIKQWMLEPVKVKCIFLGYHKSIVGNKLWRLDDVTSKVVLYMNMGFSESGEYKKTFIGSGVGAGLQEVQTQDLMDYQLAPDREKHVACELFGYTEDSNEVAFAVAAVDKIYAHESLTFNHTIACEVISKWKVRFKDDMDARSNVYVLSNGCKKCSDDNDSYYYGYTPGMFIDLFLYIDAMVFSCGCKAEIWATKGLLDKAKGNVLGMEIVWDQSGYTLRVSRSRFYNEKLVKTLLEGHSILSFEGSLSGDYDVEKNGKLSCIYAVGSQEYQMVCTIIDIASADVGSFKANLHHMEALSTTKAGYMTFTEAWKKKIWLKGLLTKSRYELRLVAGIATGALVKGSSRSEVLAQVEVAAYRLKEAPKKWHQKFDKVVMSSGFLLNQSDKCVYRKFHDSGKSVIICLCVDDMLIMGTDQNQVNKTKKFLSSRFSMKDMEEADVILGIKIKLKNKGIVITQSHYIEKILKKFNRKDCSPASKKQTCITDSTMESEFVSLAAAEMAYTTSNSSSSSSSDSKVSTCSKEYLKAYATLKEQYDSLTSDYKKSQHNVFSYKAGLQSVEERLVHYKKNESVFTEIINVLNLEVKLRDNVLAEYTTNLEKAEKERDELKLTLEKLQNSLKSFNTLLDSQVSDKSKAGIGYKELIPESFIISSELLEKQDNRSDKGYDEVPPSLTGNYMPLKHDLRLIDEHFESEYVDVSNVSSSVVTTVKTVDANHKGMFSKEKPKPVKKNSFSPLIIEDWVSETEEED
nr:zinc finger, CCHC-type [Tanacetum cinerariifolium]